MGSDGRKDYPSRTSRYIAWEEAFPDQQVDFSVFRKMDRALGMSEALISFVVMLRLMRPFQLGDNFSKYIYIILMNYESTA